MPPETKVAAGQYDDIDHRLQKFSVHTAQIVIYPLLLALRLLMVRNKTIRKLKINNSKANYIIYANHQSKLDPLIICASLPLAAVKQLMPFRFFVENSYFRGFMKHFLNIMGGFPARYDASRPYGLNKARTLMASGQTIVIFPPGIRTRERIAKPGISVLATEPNTYLLPVHIDWKHRWRCEVYIGKPLKVKKTSSPERLMRNVYKLPKALN